MGNGQPGHVINYGDNYPNYPMPIQPPPYIDSSFFPTEFEHSWVHSSPHSPIPPNAIVGGHDSDGSVIYVGRSFHEGDHLPAKVVPSKGQAYVAWGGNEVNVHHYEILCGHNYNWIPCAMGRVPLNAVRTGTTSTGEPLYVGRGHHCGSLTVGKIHPTHHCLYIPFGGQEHRLDTYEVLVQDRGETWSRSAGSFIPPGAVHAGHDSDGSLIYVGRAYHAGELLPAKVVQNKGCAYVSHSGQEVQKYEYEILLSPGLMWVPSAGGHIPHNAVSGGHTAHNEPLYIGRGHHCGSLTPGKVHPSHRCLYIPYGGAEVRLDHYEVLVRSW